MDSEGKKRLRILLEDELPDSVASFQDEDVDVLYKKRCTSKDALRHTDLQFLANDPDPLHPTLVGLLAHYRSRVGQDVVPYATYSTVPLSFESFNFNATIPNIMFPPSELHFLGLPVSGLDWIKPATGGQAPHALFRDCGQFLQNKKMGTSEDALHGRDDCVFKVMQAVCPALKVATRNLKTDGSVGDTRLDLTLAETSKPPCVLCEEKDWEGELGKAEQELQDNWAPIPQYSGVPFIPGVAIAGDKVKFVLLSRQGGEEGRSLEMDLTIMVDRIRCLQAAVNVARLCTYIHEKDLLGTVRLAFNVAHHFHDKTLLLSLTSVRKCYLKMDEASADRLTNFYKDTRYARFVEKGEATGDASKGFAFELTPVGWEHLPTTLMALRIAVKCILIALRDCHEVGWTINDLRWPNIIDVAGEWYVIDCEFARPIGANLPSMTIRPPGQFCSPTSDLFMLHHLLHDVRRLFQSTTQTFKSCSLQSKMRKGVHQPVQQNCSC